MAKKNKKSSLDKTEDLKENNLSDDEPSWYHYFLIILVLVGFFFIIHFLFEYYDSIGEVEIVDINNNSNSQKYFYKYTSGNITYNVELILPTNDLEKLDYLIEVNKLDILNTVSFKFIFGTYNGSDNGQVSLASIKLRRVLTDIFNYKFSKEDFITSNSSCINSSNKFKEVVFEIDPSREPSVLKEKNGCIHFIVREGTEFPYLTDYFILSLLKDE